MNLLLTVYHTPAWEALIDATGLQIVAESSLVTVEGIGLLKSVQSLSRLSSVLLPNIAVEQSLWLAVVQAEYFLANAVENGSTIEKAAEQWQQQTQALLALHRQHRRQLQIFNIHQALARPAAFRDILSSIVVLRDYPPQVVDNSLALLAASQYVNQQPELKALNTRLQASALPICSGEALVLDIDYIVQLQSEEATKLQDITAERDLILSQLLELQEQLEEHYLSLQSEQQKRKLAAARAARAESMSQFLQQELVEIRNSRLWKIISKIQGFRRIIRRDNFLERARIVQNAITLLSSEYFDVEWYIKKYPDVAESKINPALHYLRFGAAEGRLPGPSFDGNWYLQRYPEVAAAGMNPLLHYIEFGQKEGRSGSSKVIGQ